MSVWLINSSIFVGTVTIYASTLLLGLLGNCWVLASVLRTTKKSVGAGSTGGGHRSPSIISPSNRLRKYIWLLALLDFCVSLSLGLRLWHLLMPEQPISSSMCQLNYCLDQLFKLCSLTCLASISIERFITIRKPFNNRFQFRQIAVRLTPCFAFLSVAICASAIFWLSWATIGATEDGLNCTQMEGTEEGDVVASLAQWTLAIGFSTQLAVIGTNYMRIVHHVRRKFWQRKARAVANSFSANRSLGQSLSGESQRIACGTAKLVKQHSPPLLVLAEPKYMGEMTTAIMRIAVFHLLCWLPFCLLQLAPSLQSVFPFAPLDSLRMRSAIPIAILDGQQQGEGGGMALASALLAFCANWLTYANSAGNWVFYAALNRDLRSIIKACSERRKRSTFSQQQQPPHSPTIRRSVRRSAFQTLRLFYSLNSHRSSASVEHENYSGATILASASPCGCQCPHLQQQQTIEGSAGSPQTANLRAPCGAECSAAAAIRKHSAQSMNNSNHSGSGTVEGAGARRSPSELGAFGYRDGRAHTYCAPKVSNGMGPLTTQSTAAAVVAPTKPLTAQIQSAHLRVAQQIIIAVYGNREQQQQQHRAGKERKGSAAERRELFAQRHSPVPPPIHIVSIMGASTDSEPNSSEA